MSALPNSLRAIAKALGGVVNGSSVQAPGPGHYSPRDRSLSVTPDANAPDGFLVNSFAGDDPIACKDYVRVKLGLPAFSPTRGPARAAGGQDPNAPTKAPAPPPEKHALASWLWSGHEPVTESNAAGLYLRKRGYGGPFPATLGYLPANGEHPPAMIAAFGFCDEPEPGLTTPPDSVTGIHLTRLTMQGDKAHVDPVKIMIGPSMRLPIVLAPANNLLAIDITEGIETGLSVLEMRGAGVWVAGAAGRLPALVENLPGYVECLHIFAERDAGMRFAQEAARIAAARGIEAHVKAYEAKP